MTKKNKTILYSKYDHVGNFNDGLCAVSKKSFGEPYAYMDKKGNLVIPFQYYNVGDFKHGFAPVRTLGKNEYGLINRKGELIIPYLYDEITPLTADRVKVQTLKGYGLIDEKGNVILPTVYAEITYDDIGDCFVVGKDYYGKKMIYDKNAKLILPDTFDHVYPFNKQGWAAVKKKDKYGFLNKKFQFEVPLIYDGVAEYFANDYIAVQQGKAYFFIDKNQKRLDSLTFDWIDLSYFNHKGNPKYEIRVSKGEKYGVINSKNFQTIIPCWYEDLVELPLQKKWLIRVKKDGKIGYINIKNEIIVPFEYDDYREYQFPLTNKLHIEADSKAVLFKDGKCGILDVAQNKIIIPFEYENLLPMDLNENVIFYRYGKTGLINAKNEIIIPAEYESIQLNYNGLYQLNNNGAIRLATKDGKKISEYYEKAEAIPTGFIVVRNEKYGFVDVNLNETIPIIYKYGKNIKQDLSSSTRVSTAFTAFSNDYNLYEIFDAKGKSMLPEGHFSNGEMYHNLFPIKSFKGEGFMDTSRNIVIPCIYQRMRAFGKGFIARKGGMYGVIDEKNNIIHPFIYNDIGKGDEKHIRFYRGVQIEKGEIGSGNGAAGFNQGLARMDLLNEDLKFETNFEYQEIKYENGYFFVVKDGKPGILDENLKTIIPFQYEGVFQNGNNFIAYKNGKAGLINKANKMVLPFEYEKIYNTPKDYCIVENGQKKGLLKGEKIIIPIEYDEFDLYSSNKKNWIKARKNNKWGFIDEKNQIKIPLIFEKEIKERNDSTFYFQENNQTGVIDLKGNVLLPAEFSSISDYLSDEGFRVQKGQKEGYWRKDGTVYFKGEEFIMKYDIYDELAKITMSDSILGIKRDGKWGFMSETGRVIVAPKYHSLNTDYETGKHGCIVTLNGKKGIVNIEGKEVIPTEYEDIVLGNSDFPVLKKNNKWGYKHLITNEMIDFKYDEAFLFQGGFTKVKMNEKWGGIDRKGDLKIPCLYDDVRHAKDDIWIVTLNEKQALINEKQQILYDFTSYWIDITPIGIYILHDYQSMNKYFIVSPDFKIHSGPHHGAFFYNNAVIIYDEIGYRNNYKYSLVLDSNKQIQQVPIEKTDLSDHTPKEEKTSFGDYQWIHRPFKTLRSANRLPFQKGRLYGLMNPQGKIIVEPKYEMMGTLAGNMMPVKYKGNFGFIDSMGKTIIEFFLEDAHNFYNDIAIIKKDGKWGAMNRSGKLVIPFQYYELLDFVNGVTIGKTSEKDVFYQFIDQEGNLLGQEYQGQNANKFKNQNMQPLIADGITTATKKLNLPNEFGTSPIWSEGKILAHFNYKYGYINEDTSPSIPFIYDQAYPFYQNIALVSRHYKSFYINQQGKCVLGCGN